MRVKEFLLFESDKTPHLHGLSFKELDRLCESVGADPSKFDTNIRKNLHLPEWTNTLELYGIYVRHLKEQKSDSTIEKELFDEFAKNTTSSVNSANVGDKVALLHMNTLNIPGTKIVAHLNGFLNPKEIANIIDETNFKQLVFIDGSRYPEKDEGNVFQTVQTLNMTKLFETYEDASKVYSWYVLKGNDISNELELKLNVDTKRTDDASY